MFNGNILKQLRIKFNKTQEDMSKICSVSRASYTNWELGNRTPDVSMINFLAEYFGVSTDYILGRSDTQKYNKGIKIPVLGYVRAGIPIEAVEEILDYEEITEYMANLGEHFALRVKGDSMEPKFSDGDVVIVRQQSDIISGDIAVVLVNGQDATIKKVIKHKEGISLVALNPLYEPLFFSNAEIEKLPITISGKAVELRAKL